MVLEMGIQGHQGGMRDLQCLSGVGVIDQDYCGPQDEVLVQVYNFTARPVTVARGERIAQGLFVRVDRAAWEETTAAERPTRGGFGSTDAASRRVGR